MNMAGLYARLAPSLLDIIEFLLVFATLVLILIRSRNRTAEGSSGPFFPPWFSRLARKKFLSAVIVGLLVLGERLGRPWMGQWLITALMCSALCWMLQGWLPPAWALFGGLLAALRLGILSYWMNGYWSASVVALAGALVL